VLVNVSTLQAGPDGTAEKWDYLFYSPKARQGYSVDIKGGKVVNTLEVSPYIKDAVGDFVDSDKAMTEAKKNSLTVKGKVAMSVIVMGQATKNPVHTGAWSAATRRETSAWCWMARQESSLTNRSCLDRANHDGKHISGNSPANFPHCPCDRR
jgi:hypothetical protein